MLRLLVVGTCRLKVLVVKASWRYMPAVAHHLPIPEQTLFSDQQASASATKALMSMLVVPVGLLVVAVSVLWRLGSRGNMCCSAGFGRGSDRK